MFSKLKQLLSKQALEEEKDSEEEGATLATFKKGEVLIRQGGEAKMAFLIESGTVNVASRNAGETEHIVTLGRGQVVGEMALIKGYHHSASVIANEDVEAWVITTKYINKEMARMSSLMNLILLSLVERLYNQTFVKEKSE
jgi:CRP-like cAMP-binding protein